MNDFAQESWLTSTSWSSLVTSQNDCLNSGILTGESDNVIFDKHPEPVPLQRVESGQCSEFKIQWIRLQQGSPACLRHAITVHLLDFTIYVVIVREF